MDANIVNDQSAEIRFKSYCCVLRNFAVSDREFLSLIKDDVDLKFFNANNVNMANFWLVMFGVYKMRQPNLMTKKKV